MCPKSFIRRAQQFKVLSVKISTYIFNFLKKFTIENTCEL